MPPIEIPKEAIDKKTIDTSECTHPAGHCFGDDGGSGVPEQLKVGTGRGGEARVVDLAEDGQSFKEDAYYNRCQYCLKYTYVESKQERDAKEVKDISIDA